MNLKIIILLIFLMVPNSFAYNKIIQFDMNEDIIITTTVYNSTGKQCLQCTCNLTIYNTAPNETFINFSNLMVNKGNGIYTTNVTSYKNLSYSTQVYPMSIVCNDSNNFFGGDDRDGIKVSETLFDYTAPILTFIGIAVCVLWASFKFEKEFKEIKKLTFFSSFAFMFVAAGLSFITMKNAPNNSEFLMFIEGGIAALLMLILAVIYLLFKDRLIGPVETISKGRFGK